MRSLKNVLAFARSEKSVPVCPDGPLHSLEQALAAQNAFYEGLQKLEAQLLFLKQQIEKLESTAEFHFGVHQAFFTALQAYDQFVESFQFEGLHLLRGDFQPEVALTSSELCLVSFETLPDVAASQPYGASRSYVLEESKLGQKSWVQGLAAFNRENVAQEQAFWVRDQKNTLHFPIDQQSSLRDLLENFQTELLRHNLALKVSLYQGRIALSCLFYGGKQFQVMSEKTRLLSYQPARWLDTHLGEELSFRLAGVPLFSFGNSVYSGNHPLLPGLLFYRYPSLTGVKAPRAELRWLANRAFFYQDRQKQVDYFIFPKLDAVSLSLGIDNTSGYKHLKEVKLFHPRARKDAIALLDGSLERLRHHQQKSYEIKKELSLMLIASIFRGRAADQKRQAL